MDQYFEDIIFENKNYTNQPLTMAVYEACHFQNCDFSGSSLEQISFVDCKFDNCNWSNVLLAGTVIRDVHFQHCKMMGLHFETCSDFLFAASFALCTLNLSSFYQLNMKNAQFDECILHETDFTETNLTSASFAHCDLHGAVFENTNLEKADLSTARHYIIDPDKNKIKKAKFAKESLEGLLMKYDIVVV